jgi:acylphosphatase
MNKRIEAIVYGRVQGVAFRYATYSQATQLRLTGWVMNRPDGSVRVVAEGPEHNLTTLSAWLREGPVAARVDFVDLDWRNATGEFNNFTIRG